MPIQFRGPLLQGLRRSGYPVGRWPDTAHVPVGWRPTQLVVRVRRSPAPAGCGGPGLSLAEPRARLVGGGWELRGPLAHRSCPVSRVAAALGISWHTANNAIGPSRADPQRGARLAPRGGGSRVDEHVWRHTRQGDRYVTVMIDLTRARPQWSGASAERGPGSFKKVMGPGSPSATRNGVAGRW